MLLKISGEITSERMKRQSQIENNTQLWMWLVMEVKKVPCCEEQYCIGIWNVRFMNQGKLEVVKQEMARVNVNILGISELKWTRKGEFNSDDHYVYYCGQKSLGRNRVVLIVNRQRRQWQPTPVRLPGKSHGWRSLVGCSPWGRKESDTTERLHFHFSLSCIGEGKENPLQCFCLENPRDGGAWWAAVYGVGQSRTRLKWLSSSSSMLG